MKLAIATVYSGWHGHQLRGITYLRHQKYSRKCHADFIANDNTLGMTFPRLMMHKLEMTRNLLNTYDQVLWIDADVLIHRDSPNLFLITPEDAFSAADEGALCDGAQDFERAQHVVKTCKEEGMPVPDMQGRYFNMGVFIACKKNQNLFDRRLNPSDHNWCDQSYVNARLALSKQRTVVMPECFNRFVYWGPKPKRFWESSYFLHYAGAPSPEQRIIDMKAQSAAWGDL